METLRSAAKFPKSLEAAISWAAGWEDICFEYRRDGGDHASPYVAERL